MQRHFERTQIRFVRNAEILAPARRQLIAAQEAQMQQHGQQPDLPFVSKYKVRFSQTMTVKALHAF